MQYLFTLGGAPLNAINVITLNIYHTGIRDHRIGRASAMSIILLIIMVVLTAVIPDFPLDADQVANVIYVIVAFIIGTGLEEARLRG